MVKSPPYYGHTPLPTKTVTWAMTVTTSKSQAYKNDLPASKIVIKLFWL